MSKVCLVRGITLISVEFWCDGTPDTFAMHVGIPTAIVNDYDAAMTAVWDLVDEFAIHSLRLPMWGLKALNLKCDVDFPEVGILD